jgi:GNAT superfamily N-acetyltransferase
MTPDTPSATAGGATRPPYRRLRGPLIALTPLTAVGIVGAIALTAGGTAAALSGSAAAVAFAAGALCRGARSPGARTGLSGSGPYAAPGAGSPGAGDGVHGRLPVEPGGAAEAQAAAARAGGPGARPVARRGPSWLRGRGRASVPGGPKGVGGPDGAPAVAVPQSGPRTGTGTDGSTAGAKRAGGRDGGGEAVATGIPPGAGEQAGEPVLWRLRTTVRNEPGSLAALCAVLADLGVDILTLQTHPLAEGTVDEFLLRVPPAVDFARLTEEITAAGGRNTWAGRADPRELADSPTQALGLALRTALDPAELPLALRRLLGRCAISSRPAVSPAGRPAADLPPAEGVLDETVMRLRDATGGEISVERPYLPFTPAEFARARALVELDTRLGPLRLPAYREEVTLPEGERVTVRRAGPGDLSAALGMHERCSAESLRQRYHGPVRDADLYLSHLLNPRHGRTLAARTDSGRLVALGHLLWDGDETEVALLVEDDWQRRGLGSELLERLTGLARSSGSRGVYAVTRSSNTGMVAAMRGLGLPLDYRIEEGTMVITARWDTPAADGTSGPAGRAHADR